MRRFSAAVVLFIICTPGLRSQEGVRSDQKAIEQALLVFVTAFDNLDWATFRTCFSNDASVFYPTPQIAKRIDSAADFNQAWLAVFDAIKKASGRTAPPYMDLVPRDLRIDLLSPGVAIAPSRPRKRREPPHVGLEEVRKRMEDRSSSRV
jgi:hypothetical protein